MGVSCGGGARDSGRVSTCMTGVSRGWGWPEDGERGRCVRRGQFGVRGPWGYAYRYFGRLINNGPHRGRPEILAGTTRSG